MLAREGDQGGLLAHSQDALQQDTNTASACRWSFGPAVLDERTLELRVNAQPVELERKSLEVLQYLLRHAGEVVTKDEILEAVWPGRILSETVLTKCISRIRDALGDDNQSFIKTQHGYGYRLICPVLVEASAAPAPPRFDFKPGDHPLNRPHWLLQERLGAGGHGEVWLARHAKTRETRVFKFALGESHLVSLKREITLSRLLRDALGADAPAAQVVDWNLETPPYFLEVEHSMDGSLVQWAQGQGGAGRIPLSSRLDIAAQIAEAVGQVHSVGVLHKDLKPSNILIESPGDEPDVASTGESEPAAGVPRNVRIRLSDFGSGGVLDAARLEALGITRMGFTGTISQLNSTSGTPIYLAPEIVAGQPATVQGDVYALGVILYQLLCGDLHKPLSPGWEDDIGDELLREDIAVAVAGNPAKRLDSAASLAARIRSLDERRARRDADRLARETAEAHRLEVERVRARRVWVRTTMAVLVLGTSVSLVLLAGTLRARQRAEAAAAVTKSVSDFLSKDMFAAVSVDQRPVRDLSVKELLDSAAAQIEQRFVDHPEIAAELHAAIGESYNSLSDGEDARAHWERAIALDDRLQGPGSEAAIDVAARLVPVKYALGELGSAMESYAAMLGAARQRLGQGHPGVLKLRRSLAYGRYWLGDWPAAVRELKALLEDAARAEVRDDELIGRAESLLGLNLGLIGEYRQGETELRKALSILIPVLGENHLGIANVRRNLGENLTEAGRYAEAESELASALAAARRWIKDDSGDVLSIRLTQGRLLCEKGQPAEAVGILLPAMQQLIAWQGPTMDQTTWFREALGEAYQRLGLLADAESEMRRALAIGEKTLAAGHPALERFRIGLADILSDEGNYAGAGKILGTVNTGLLQEKLSRHHPYLAHFRQVQSRIFRHQGDYAKARAALAEAQQIYQMRLGAESGKARRASRELADLSAEHGT